MAVASTTTEFTAYDLARGEALFKGPCTFVKGVVRIDDLPKDGRPEVAFAGRSNVGKSSLINALTGRKTLAKVSNTPGRTRQLNFFDLAGRLMVADLPGYGYARASKEQVADWTKLVKLYLVGRATLRRALVLIDARHGPKDIDRRVMAMLDGAAVSYQAVLTKTDQPKASELAALQEKIAGDLAKHPAAYPQILTTSARMVSGIDELRAAVASLTP